MSEAHDKLVEKAVTWLKRRHPLVIAEMVTGCETPDAIGFKANGLTTLVECKVSRADFRTDAKKPFRKVGGMGSRRYFLTPLGLIKVEELPKGWGLLELSGRGVRVTKDLKYHAYRKDKDTRAELGLLLSCMRRLGNHKLSGVSVKAYTYETQNTAQVWIQDPEQWNWL